MKKTPQSVLAVLVVAFALLSAGCITTQPRHDFGGRLSGAELTDETHSALRSLVDQVERENLTPAEACDRFQRSEATLNLRVGRFFQRVDERFVFEALKATYCVPAAEVSYAHGSVDALGPDETDLLALARNAKNLNQTRRAAAEATRRYLAALAESTDESAMAAVIERQQLHPQSIYVGPEGRRTLSRSGFEEGDAARATQMRLDELAQARVQSAQRQKEAALAEQQSLREAQVARRQEEEAQARATPEYWAKAFVGRHLMLSVYQARYETWTRRGEGAAARQFIGPSIHNEELALCRAIGEMRQHLSPSLQKTVPSSIATYVTQNAGKEDAALALARLSPYLEGKTCAAIERKAATARDAE